MLQISRLWHHAAVSCKLRVISACVALNLPRLIAGGASVVPTIVVSEAVEPGAPLTVMFAPPATTPAQRSEIRFKVTPGQIAPPASASEAPVSATLPARVSMPGAAADAASAANSAAVRESSTAVSFAAPRYERPPPAPSAPQVSRLDRETVAACLVLEAASQGDYGMRAVMAVICNRAAGQPELFARTALQPKQFSALNKVTAGRESLYAAIQRAKRDRVWNRALAIVNEAVLGDWQDPTGGATHYTRSAERTQWTRSLAKTTTIGAHSFYR